MRPIRILVDSLADAGLPNAQMTNAREIIRRLNPDQFQVTVFHGGHPDSRVQERPNTRLIALPGRVKTLTILKEFIFGGHQILFYVKSSPASRYYFLLKGVWRDGRVTIGTIESRSDLGNEPTISAGAVRLWEHTVLRCQYLFSNSAAVKSSLQAEYGIPSEVIPTGVDTKFFVPRKERGTGARPRVLFVGSLRPFKQPDLLLEAALQFPEADFVIAGDGLMAGELRARVEKERLANVTLTGPLDAEGLLAEYQRADVFLFPSRWEGSPKVILEAAACGLPVIARSDYSPETVIDGETGYLAVSNDELLLRLRDLLNDPEKRQCFGEAGRRHAGKFDWDVIVRRWEEVFIRLAPDA
jgi:glycosyltransferase involved in cell wall biosynthesis